MAITYTQTVINARLSAVVTAIGAGGKLVLLQGGTILTTVPLATPCGTVANGQLTFTMPETDPSAVATGAANTGLITDAGNNLMVTGLTVGVPLSGANVIMTNGRNDTFIFVGQTVTCNSGIIIGS